MIRFSLIVASLLLLAGQATAQSVCATHRVQAGDTLFSIAEDYFGDHAQWSRVYYANQARLGGGLFELPAGLELTIPCVEGQAVADATPLQVEDAEMRLVTGSNYAPFTDRAWVGEGMATELVNAALESMPSPVTYSIAWEDDWSKHLFPMLDDKQVDMGFPWLQPDCAATPDNERCANFHFSDPLVEMLVLLFVHKDRQFEFSENEEAAIQGKTLCRPAGYFTHDLDRSDRQWLDRGVVELVQAESPDACFELLLQGAVDAVTVNEFLGLTKIHELGLRETVVPLRRPLSIEGLHVIISKRHWRGTTFLYRFNAGLEALKASQRYDEIVSRHLGLFWETVN